MCRIWRPPRNSIFVRSKLLLQVISLWLIFTLRIDVYALRDLMGHCYVHFAFLFTLIIRTYMRPVCRRCDMHIFSERCLPTASRPKRVVVLGGACLEWLTACSQHSKWRCFGSIICNHLNHEFLFDRYAKIMVRAAKADYNRPLYRYIKVVQAAGTSTFHLAYVIDIRQRRSY